MGYYIANACSDENRNLRNGKAGDQLQTSTTGNDYKGEVKLTPFYVHSKNWYILRPKDSVKAHAMANAAIDGCNNANIGYDQNNRMGVYNFVKAGIRIADISKPTECDCSGLMRAAYREAYGEDIDNFTTLNEVDVLMKTGRFTKLSYTSGMRLYVGDILVTQTKGHTGIIAIGYARYSYYPAYGGNSVSIVVGLKATGENDTSFAHRKKIALKNGIVDSLAEYTGTSAQNRAMLNLLKAGRLIKA